MAKDIILVGVKSYSMEKDGNKYTGVTLHTQTSIDTDKGVGYEVDKISISSRADCYTKISRMINDRELTCGDVIKVCYNKYGKAEDVEKVG